MYLPEGLEDTPFKQNKSENIQINNKLANVFS